MSERTPVSQISLGGDLPSKGRDGHAVESSSAAAMTLPGTGKPGIKHPHFLINSGKLREAMFYRWKLALIVGLMAAGVGAGLAWLTYKPKYTATALLRMTSSKPRLLPGGQPEDGSSKNEEGFQKTQAQMLKARDVLAAVLKKDQIRGLAAIRNQETPMLWLEKELQGSFVVGTDIFRIALSGEDAQEVALIVNTVKDVFYEQFVKNSKQERADQFANIEKVMVQTEEKIRTMRSDLRKLAETLKTGDTQVLTIRQKMALEEYGSMKRELSILEAETRRTVAQLVVQRGELQTIETADIPPEMFEEFLERENLVQKEKSEIARLELKLKDYGKLLTGSSPRLVELQAGLQMARAQLEKAKVDNRPEVAEKIRAHLKVQLRNNLVQTESKLKVLNEQQPVVADQVKQLGKEADKIGLGSFEIEFRRNEIDEAELILKKLRAEKERLEIEKFNNKETIATIQDAEVPTLNQASLLKTGGLFSVVGLLLGCWGVSYFEARLHRVHRSVQVSQELGIESLGVLPLLTQNAGRNYGRHPPAGESVPGVMFSDAVDSLCARLLCDDRLGQNSVLMVTSASQGEGKTMLATHLATGFARSGRKTLLVDCDFRNPRCHAQLGLDASTGLSEVLCGAAELATVLHHVPDSEASFLPAGKCNSDVVKALNNGNFAALLTRLRLDFDCIIVDSAPTPVVADGLLIGKLADGVILVVRPKVSKSPAVFAAHEQLAVLNIRILGAVVNADPARTTGYYYK